MEVVAEFEYNAKDLIGHGAFAVVYKGRYTKNPDHTVAIKCITKKNIAKSQSLLSKEIKILKELTELHHENVVALLHCHETQNHVFLVMEYCNGGDLADYLQAKGTLSESTIKLFLGQLADAMQALAGKGVVHRDLKPQNILLSHDGKPNPPPDLITLKIGVITRIQRKGLFERMDCASVSSSSKSGVVRFWDHPEFCWTVNPLSLHRDGLDNAADFGFARFLQDGVMAATLCGSPMYMAPEVIMSLQYDAKADLWSLGTIVFQCLTGKAPFHAQTPQALKNYYEKNSSLAPRIPSGTSPGLADLLMGLLKRNSRDRLTFEEFFNHPYIRSDEEGALGDPKSNKEVISIVKKSAKVSRREVSPPSTAAQGIPGSGRDPCAPSPPAAHLPPSPEDLGMSVEHQKAENGYPLSSSPIRAGRVCPKHIITLGGSNLSQEEADDFVMVPSCIPADHDPSRAHHGIASGRITPSGRRTSSSSPVHKMGQISPSARPSQLPFHGGSGGSMSTHSSESGESYKCSEPVPVPSQKDAFQRMTSSGSSDMLPAGLSDSSQNSNTIEHGPQQSVGRRSQPINVKRGSEMKTPDISSLSPPTVQFTIGTPPNVAYRRRSSSCSSYSTTPPNVGYCATGGRVTPTNSPLRSSGRRTPPYFSPHYCSPSGLPPILGSPNKMHLGGGVGQDNIVGDICGNHPSSAPPFGASNRARTLPEMSPCHQPLGAIGDCSMEGSGLHRSRTDSHIFEWQMTGCSPPETNSRQLIHYGQTMQGFLVHPNPGFNMGVNSIDLPETMNFLALPLNQETLMEKEHNETLAKLNFVVALVDCILELARCRASIFSNIKMKMDNAAMRESLGSPKDLVSSTMVTPTPEWQRRAEQLVLYVRALQLLSSALTLAKHEKSHNRLKPSNAVKNVVALLNRKFRVALAVCKELNNTDLQDDPRASVINADKLIYNYAIEMCQNAALDELFGKPEDCFRRYQTAQILLHALAHQVAHDADRKLLNKYKETVEKRLFLLQEHGVAHAYSTQEP